MITHRLAAVTATLAAAAAVIAVGRTDPLPANAVFSVLAEGWMPSVRGSGGLTSSWFCPGVPATGEAEVGGDVIIANRSDAPLTGRLVVLADESQSVQLPVQVEPRTTLTIDLSSIVAAAFVSAVVEIDGGGGVVEQRARHPAGDSVAPCANQTSDHWYLADGFTFADSTEQVVLSNPFDDTAIVDLSFATEAGGSRSPPAFQGLPIPARTVKVISLEDVTRDEPVLAVSAVASKGQLVVGRAQHYTGGGRLGYQVTLGAPGTREQWWFADGAKAAGIQERFTIYNPTAEAVDVDVVFLGISVASGFAGIEPIAIGPGEVATVDTDTIAELPDGSHGVVVASLGRPSIVVERVITRDVGGTGFSSVSLGGTARPDGYVPTRWHVAAAPASPVTGALVVLNVDNTDGTVTVSAVGPDGTVVIPALESVQLPAAGVVAIDLTDPAFVGRELIIESSVRTFVERRVPRGADRQGVTTAWALPAG